MKPTEEEIAILLDTLKQTYIDLDMRYKVNETNYQRVQAGDRLFKVGFFFNNDDELHIRIINKTVEE
jgi:hypothetical protein